MPANFNPPGYRWFDFLRHAPAKVGIYTGVWLSVVFIAWVVIANRAPFLEPLAWSGVLAVFFSIFAVIAGIRIWSRADVRAISRIKFSLVAAACVFFPSEAKAWACTS